MTANQSTRLKTDIGSLDFLKNGSTLAALEKAADQFIKHDGDTVKIWAASRDWFMEEWGRDTFISMPGLLLTTKRYDEARRIFLRFSQYEKNGLIPNYIREDEILYNTADASLWMLHALKAYAEATDDWAFVEELSPTVRNIIDGYRKGTAFERSGQQHRLYMDEDGLIVSPPQATWMDADPSGNGSAPVTPRNGKCVEINALWYGALRFLIRCEKDRGTTDLEMLADQVRTSFREQFWNESTQCLYDVIGDGSIRPNQIIAISHGEDILELQQQIAVLTVVERELLTIGGLRTLSVGDPHYRGEYDTFSPMSIKDLSYHQGTIWPWLIGQYADAVRIVKTQQGESSNETIAGLIAPLVQFCLDSEYGSLPEVFSADEPHEPGGTTSQAWSVAEVLRTLFAIIETT